MNLLKVTILVPFFLIGCRHKTSDSPPAAVVEDTLTEVVTQQEEVVQKSTMAQYFEQLNLVDVHSVDTTIRVDLKYATTHNFTKQVLYNDLTEAYLHPIAALKLGKAQQLLRDNNPQMRLLVYDAARPMSVQKTMYRAVQHTPYRAYVADPSKTGMHNYGMAVDLTICDSLGVALDMGTPFDFFGKAAGINQEEQLLCEGLLTRQQINNRKLLRRVMTQAGFITIRGEWWHFNAGSRSQVASMRLIE